MKTITWGIDAATLPSNVRLSWVRSVVTYALKLWKNKLGNAIEFREGESPQHIKVSFAAVGQPKIHVAECTGRALTGAHVKLDPRRRFLWRWWHSFSNYDTEARVILAHEIGHALGAPHSQDKASVMNPNPETEWITYTDQLYALDYLRER